ncbi:hypothetical protein COT72_01875 [archaeon CG10_big_fil_rev_8_21_14_0_10_43_11]|nr:MAG: hypothetical protein COT72_01875 [archaeon CG10_big_fil_rev_8_21_14_0_10_43_11]
MFKVEYEVKEDKPLIHVFSRGADKKKRVDIVTGVEPYFFVLAKDQKKAEKLEHVVRVEAETKKTTLDGQAVVKVVCNIPAHVKELRKNFEHTFEADILFTNRYVIDTYDAIEQDPLRVCYLDIETNTDNTRPNIEQADHEVTAIALFDSFDKECTILTWRNDFKTEQEKKTYKFEINGKTMRVKATIVKEATEKDLFANLIAYFNRVDPDVITGWNVKHFDIYYLIKRMEALGLDPNALSPLNYTKIRGGFSGTNPVIKGRIIFDLLTGYRKMVMGQMKFYTLDHISSQELNAKKIAMPKTWGNMWRENFDTFIEYNAKDTYLVYEIDQKRKIIDYYDEVRRMAHCDFDDVIMSMRTSDSFILTYCKDKYVLPTKAGVQKRTRLKGAIVLDPVKGLHENVAVVDLKSLYPNIIISCNISPETILNKKEQDCVTIDHTYFSKTRAGIFPEILEHIFNRRILIQKERDTHKKGSEEYKRLEAKQYAIKIVMNSFYGVSANPHFRLYKKGVGDAITKVGRDTVLWSKNIAEKNGYTVLYGDTDSIFVTKKDAHNSIAEGKSVAEILNASYQKLLDRYNAPKNMLSVEFEKLYYKLLLFPETKKRYAGLITWYKGKDIPPEISVTGLETVRSDSSELAKQTQQHVLEMLFSGKTREDVNEYLRHVREQIRKGNARFEEIGISSPLKKPITAYKVDRPSVRAAKYANKHMDANFDVGSRFYVMYVKDVPGKPPTDVIAFSNDWDVPKGTVVNVDKHIEEVTGGKIERIYDAVGWEKEKPQKNLNTWF